MIRLTEPDQIGAQIRAIRLDQGLLQRELAQLAGSNTCSVSEVERGRNLPTFATAGRLLAALGYDLALVPREDM